MKVLLIGLKYFSHKLAKELREIDPGNHYLAFDTYYSKKDLLKFVYHLASADLVYSIKGTTGKSKAFDLVKMLNKRLVIQWAGTDVLTAMNDEKAGTANLNYANYASNYCEAPWLIKELAAINIKAKPLLFTSISKMNKLKPFPKNFTVFTYLGKNRADFYGKKVISRLADKYSNINFKIVGDSISTSLKNVENLGWIENLEQVIQDSHVHIRWTDHDSLANTVLETLSEGRYVIWKNEYPATFSCLTTEDLESRLVKLKDQFEAGNLGFNNHGRELVSGHFNSEVILRKVISTMKAEI